VATRWTQAATILTPTIEVCGYRLLPFCLRHRVALEAIGSPAMDKSLPMTCSHILAAARILSSHDLEILRKPSKASDNYYATRMGFSQKYLFNEIMKLHYYFEAQSLWPRFWEKEGSPEGRDSGTPWQLVIIASLVRNGFTSEEAWTMPESQAVWLHIANSQASGCAIEIVSDKEWQAMEDYKKSQLTQPPTPPKSNV
jgi:hypothetical protein